MVTTNGIIIPQTTSAGSITLTVIKTGRFLALRAFAQWILTVRYIGALGFIMTRSRFVAIAQDAGTTFRVAATIHGMRCYVTQTQSTLDLFLITYAPNRIGTVSVTGALRRIGRHITAT